ncbi:MAG TPA: saccharopine dehydrogenase C-terminal domain-containing protein [Planctomycetota bacterium]|nr:saccharopine dehydrogenase C-terminal domain-containing protein [Planctomycetota bacterium]
MQDVVILGAGKIGRMVCHLLANCGDYTVRIGDVAQPAVDHLTRKYPQISGKVVDFGNGKSVDSLLQGAFAVVSCAPFHCNPLIAERARQHGAHYFDLTEDVEVTHRVQQFATGARSAFAPQCGLAPGFITIVANHLMKSMTTVTDLNLRVGALPRYPSNRLKYNLTWSTEGLINEYCNACDSVVDGQLTRVPPLEQLERLTIDGVEYEAFNTSGGLGTLALTLKDRVKNVNYKTIRFPGHCELMKFLMHDLQMLQNQGMLREIFDRCLPTTFQDMIVIFVSATGQYRGRLTERIFAKTIYHQQIDGENWSGIQITTAAGVCAVVDLVREGKLPQQGLVKMEEIDYEAFLKNRFGRYYA